MAVRPSALRLSLVITTTLEVKKLRTSHGLSTVLPIRRSVLETECIGPGIGAGTFHISQIGDDV